MWRLVFPALPDMFQWNYRRAVPPCWGDVRRLRPVGHQPAHRDHLLLCGDHHPSTDHTGLQVYTRLPHTFIWKHTLVRADRGLQPTLHSPFFHFLPLIPKYLLTKYLLFPLLLFMSLWSVCMHSNRCSHCLKDPEQNVCCGCFINLNSHLKYNATGQDYISMMTSTSHVKLEYNDSRRNF